MLLTENILNVSSICRFYVHIIFPFDIQQPEVDGLLPLPTPNRSAHLLWGTELGQDS